MKSLFAWRFPLFKKIDIKVAYLSKCHPQNVVEAYNNIIKVNQLQHSKHFMTTTHPY
jgi:hypothetical protein